MKPPISVDSEAFQRQLRRNLLVPLSGGLVGVAVFVALIVYLLSMIGWVEHSDRVMRSATEAQRLSIDMETGMRGFLITGQESYLAPYEAALPRVGQELMTLRQLVKDNPAQMARVERITAAQSSWNELVREVIAQRRTRGTVPESILVGQGKRITDRIREEFNNFMDAEQVVRTQRNAESNRTIVIVVASFLLFTLLLMGLLGYFGRRQLLHLSSSYETIFLEQAAHATLLQQQAWLRSAQNELTSERVGEHSAADLGRKVLSFFARRMDSMVVGAFYIRDAQGALGRVASYGFSETAQSAPQVFEPEQSLVGQAATENRRIVVAPVDIDYLRVNSGLGDTAPRAVVLMPVCNDDIVNGVIELGLLHPPDVRGGELLELVARHIGTSIAAMQYRQRLQDALSDTQQLNEELQVQQEELRTVNEELEEQSRALRSSQTTMEEQQIELEQTNTQLSERTKALDQRNLALRRAQLDLEKRADELQRSSSYKTEFLANMSHELRTPLNSVLILAKLLAGNPSGNLNAEQVKFSESIYKSGNDLLELINDVLDIAKVEAGKLEVVAEEVRLDKLAAELRESFTAQAAQKQLALKVEVAPDAPAMLTTDSRRLAQILRNLLSNALKFTDKGSVMLHISGAPEGGARFAVSDTGIGIAPEHQEVIFEAFLQADGTTNRRYGGTGLGLSISRDLAQLLGGTIALQSQPGEGATFTLTLPARLPPLAARPAEPAPPAFSSPSPAAPSAAVPVAQSTALATSPKFNDDRDIPRDGTRRVLVIEDEPQFAGILYQLAHELGYRGLVAQGAAEGFNLANEHVPDAILLDMRLPDSPGLDVLQRLKSEPRTRHIPVHVISAYDHAEAALHMGAIGYATKPTTRAQLEAVFHKLEDKLTQKVRSVLLVEDDPLQRESVIQLIGDTDIVITAVQSGEQALAMLHERIFDCMITDLVLTDMQGSELLKRMAQEKICSFPPVIVYTSRNLTRNEETELLRYSRSIIIKGARSPERLLDEVMLFLHKAESDLSSDRQSMLKMARNRDRLFEGRRILLVDDDVRNLFALTSALEQRGAQVELGRNGREALEKLNTVPDIDLVLMDIMMPEMDGLEATRRLRQDPHFAHLPVIAVTAKAMKDDQQQCLIAGANDYLAKPIDLDRLFSLLRVWMPRMERL